LLVAACQTTGPKPGAQGPVTTDAAAQAQASGEFVRAAHIYDQLAQAATPPKKQDYQLKVVQMYIQGSQLAEARRRIGEIDVSGLSPAFRARKTILEAQLAHAEGDDAKALLLATTASRIRNIGPDQVADIYWVRAQANVSLGNPFIAARYLEKREHYLTDQQKIDTNQLQLWKILSNLPQTELQSRLARESNRVMRGWINLAIIGIEGARNPRELPQAIEDWRQRYPEHPINADLLATIGSRKPTMIGRIDHIALLLPLTSRYGRAAQAVRDGFMAMDAHNPDPDKPQVRIYDIGDDPTKAPDYYEQAVQDGAQLVVGPLGADAVDQLASSGDLSIPTILLSHTKADVNESNVFQFGLPPEQEARQAAERAYLDGHRQAAVLYPDNDWGQRMLKAFSDHWRNLGGIVVTSQPYEMDQGDYSGPIQKLLNITQSMQRRDLLEQKLGLKLKFHPRARADIDMIFLAADPQRGRLIKPQLNYNQASNIPVYSTSSIYYGKPDAAKDADLNGIIFGDMPWMLLDTKHMENLRQTLEKNWPYAYTPYDRLFALGVDSYAIVPHLSRIASDPSVHFNGVTSGLSIDPAGHLHRQLIWARFRRGIPRLVDSILRYREQLDIGSGKDATAPALGTKG
jgi:outer membrane PBP1 activator LpoA protein